MAHIKLTNEELPGIVGLLNYSPATAKPLLELANVLLREDNTLSRTEREIIAATVSYRNDCHFCHTSHAAAAVAHAGADVRMIDDIKAGLVETTVSPGSGLC
ncbi:carboxymuconolactone decarboxylase family protein [Puia sp. P3]|uniref:carboxymuconolactone decarboxylase family protein n=1 Tax=Puia sp. P3 TaxID=3423952 RepID=UPI003D679044